MIKVKRPAEPPTLAAARAAELKLAKTRFRKMPAGTPINQRKRKPASEASEAKETKAKFEFSAYSLPEVRLALQAAFHGKCAYCEARYAGVHPMDVEHWRPKAEVHEYGDDGKRRVLLGYWWLAAVWDNLLPSCISCNRPREQEIQEVDTRERRRRVSGKGNRFPIAVTPEAAWSCHPGGEAAEEPLLLHPYVDDPKDHLEFPADADGLVLPAEPSQKGKSSIEVYALNRVDLVQDRREVLQLLLQRMESVRRLVEILNRLLGKRPQDRGTIRLVEELLALELAEVKAFRNPRRAFSQMARQVIDRFMAQYKKPGSSRKGAP